MKVLIQSAKDQGFTAAEITEMLTHLRPPSFELTTRAQREKHRAEQRHEINLRRATQRVEAAKIELENARADLATIENNKPENVPV